MFLSFAIGWSKYLLFSGPSGNVKRKAVSYLVLYLSSLIAWRRTASTLS